MTTHAAGAAGAFSISRLRTFILVALVAGVALFTGVMLTLVQSLSDRFGPQVAADLEWRALRGAQELSKTADVGLAVSDTAMVQESFGAYAQSADVAAILAIDAQSKLVASHAPRLPASIDGLSSAVFRAKPGTLVNGSGYVASWAPAVIEGNQVGKVAVVVSTQRMSDAQAVLSRVSRTTLIAGVAGALLGALVILFFTRQVSLRDHRLNDYAHNLERKVEDRTRDLDERNRGMRLVLDNVAQGFITIDLDGTMASERSAIVDRWFGEPAPGIGFGALVASHDANFATWFALGLDAVREGILPLALCLEQMPQRFTVAGKTFEVSYSPIQRGERLERILLIVSDITEHLVRERSEREQREMVTLFQRITADRSGFDEFMEEASMLVGSLARPGDPLVERRTVHTLKGNCAIYGFDGYAELCNNLETEIADSDEVNPLSSDHRHQLIDGWRKVTSQMAQLLGESRRNVIEVDFIELARVVERAKQSPAPASRELAAILTAWTHEPVARRFERLARYATALARRLGKPELDIAIADDGIRLDTSRWVAFWSAMIHAVRNAIDHGIESVGSRNQAGKPERARLAFAAARMPGELTISVTDDGGGIDWDRVREHARAQGVPADSQRDLEQALFADGFSTAAEVSDVSGRGVGLAALRVATLSLGGVIEIDSERARGTTLRFRFPEADATLLPLRAPSQPIRRIQ
jgi:two-component system chemotaxis sensor kinase CheA